MRDSEIRRSHKYPDWWPDWKNQTVVIVASGPSADQVPLSLAKGKARVIAINSSWKLAPWADALYACDFAWWNQHGGVPEFQGLKVSIDGRAATTASWNVKHLLSNRGDDRLVTNEPGRVGWGGNSGFHALNFVAQTHPKRILLVAYDMTIRFGLHWHGKHEGKLNNPSINNLGRWKRAIDNAACDLLAMGIEVINCSQISELENYIKLPFEEALAG